MATSDFLCAYCGGLDTYSACPQDCPDIQLEYPSLEMSKKGKYAHALANVQKCHIPLIWGEVQKLKFNGNAALRMVKLDILKPPFIDSAGKERREFRGIYLEDFNIEIRNGQITDRQHQRSSRSVLIARGNALSWPQIAPSLAGIALKHQEERAQPGNPYGVLLALNCARESFWIPTDLLDHTDKLTRGAFRAVFADPDITDDACILLLLPAPC